MMSVYYGLEEQLERVEEEIEDFVLNKPVSEMSEDELKEAEENASKYVHWVEHEGYSQLVPMDKKTGNCIFPL